MSSMNNNNCMNASSPAKKDGKKKQKRQSFSELCADDSKLAILIGKKAKLQEFLSKNPNCTMFGQTNQGSDFVSTEGNKIVKTFVNINWLSYSRLSRDAKTKLTRDFLIKLKDGNKEEGLPPQTFIQKEGNGEDALFYQYYAEHEKAFKKLREKISQALRDRKRAEDEKKEKAIKASCASVNIRSSANMISNTTVSHENIARPFATKNNDGSIPTNEGSTSGDADTSIHHERDIDSVLSCWTISGATESKERDFEEEDESDHGKESSIPNNMDIRDLEEIIQKDLRGESEHLLEPRPSQEFLEDTLHPSFLVSEKSIMKWASEQDFYGDLSPGHELRDTFVEQEYGNSQSGVKRKDRGYEEERGNERRYKK